MSDNEHDRIVDPEAGVVEGEDEIPRQPAPPLDPYTPDPGPRAGDERAFRVLRLAWIPILIAVVIIVIALFR
ncbi:MAG TPA: hypothetical protein VIF36_00240 [Gaiellaceae bacterium]|jgi:hypothetical protein